ncbi:MAG: AI-2E family transporter [Candidatus Nanopelagicales bacterium]|nr:AI-2E family transporter [Candidatus Nanopelagicales bacterium]
MDNEPAPREERSTRKNPTFIALEPRYLKRAIFLVLVGILIFQIVTWSFGLLAGFLFNLLLAWLLAISIDPIVTGLAARGMRRGVATSIVAVGGIVLVGGFIVLFGGALASQITELIIALPLLVLDLVEWFNGTFDANINPVEITANLNLTSEQITTIASSLAGGIFGVVFSVIGVVFSLLTILVFSFYFSADSPRIKRFIAGWLPHNRQLVFINVWDISVRKAGGFVISKLALASLSAAAHIGFFYLIDIPYWLPMGIFAGLVSQFIPTIGTYLGVILPALFAAFEQPLDVLWIVIFATVYQQIENYVFTPRISTATMDINSGVALGAVFVGAALFGPIGAIIGIPIVAIIIAVIEAYGRRYDLHPEVEERTQVRKRRTPVEILREMQNSEPESS